MDTIDNLRKEAKRWLRALREGDANAYSRFRGAYSNPPDRPGLRDVQHALAKEMGHESWIELSRALAGVAESPDLARLERLAGDVLVAYQTGDAGALSRLQQVFNESITWDRHRALVARVLNGIGAPGWSDPVTLSRARLFIALEAGLESWEALQRAVQSGVIASKSASTTDVLPGSADPMQPVELRATFPMELQDRLCSTTAEVWRMLVAARAGDLALVQSLVQSQLGLVRCEHNYVPPLQLAVREGHVEVVEYLLQQGAYDTRFVTYPYKESIHVVAGDREFTAIAQLLEHYRNSGRPRMQGIHGAGHVDLSGDPNQADRAHLERLIDADALNTVEQLGSARPDLIRDPLLFWAEGVLSSPCQGHRLEMIELLFKLGARVPEIAKWAPYYYFRHFDVAQKLLKQGMNPNHMNWHRTTLLHHMAWEGNVEKATLLLDYGANIDASDDEFRSTPLGLAAKAGHMSIVSLLLDRGADRDKAGAPWAAPMAWARRRERSEIESVLRTDL